MEHNPEILESSISQLAEELNTVCMSQKLMIATAESCTGGMIAAAITDIAGSSAVFDRGFATYSNQSKADLLGVPIAHTQNPGAVSALVASEMVEGALDNSDADIAVAVTGIAGPGGGSPEKPVGLVYIASQRKGENAIVQECHFGDESYEPNRGEVRQLTVIEALQHLIDLAKDVSGVWGPR